MVLDEGTTVQRKMVQAQIDFFRAHGEMGRVQAEERTDENKGEGTMNKIVFVDGKVKIFVDKDTYFMVSLNTYKKMWSKD